MNNLLKDSDKTFQFNENEIDLIDENNLYNVLDADSSQISAIREALLSSDLFIDAPEGSKKLDTIVNLISEIIANKKHGWFECESGFDRHWDEREHRFSGCLIKAQAS